MARPNRAVAYIRHSISTMAQREEWWKIDGMIELACHLDKITEIQAEELTAELEEAYDNLDC